MKGRLSRLYLGRPRPARGYHVATPAPEHNVVGIAIAEKTVGGRRTGRLAVTLLVQRKFPASAVRDVHRLPRSIDGVEIDVREVGIFQPHQLVVEAVAGPGAIVRPVAAGSGAGCDAPLLTAGTIGAIVVRDGSGRRAILGNCHVFAAEGRTPLDTPIFQPAPPDLPADPINLVARLSRFQPFAPLPVANAVDAAVADLANGVDSSLEIPHIGRPTGIGDANPAHEVHKFGRTTEYTVGRIISTTADITMLYATGEFLFTDQLLIESVDSHPFSTQGDSGALVVDRVTGAAVGLVMAGSGGHTLANPMRRVAETLGVALA